MDNDTDDLLKSMLTGVSDQGASGSAGPGNLLDVEAGAGPGVDFDRQLLSPADSAVSSGSGSHSGSSYGAGTTPPTSRTAIDFMDIFNGNNICIRLSRNVVFSSKEAGFIFTDFR